MRYAVLLSPQALARAHSVLGENGSIDVLMDVRALIAELASPRDECLVLDPALITPAIAQTIATNLAEFPRPIIAYSSVTTEALESGVLLAQYTAARFVFRGTPNERSALEQALLLTPDSNLGAELLVLLQRRLELLPSGLRQRLTAMFRNGDGPHSPDALAAASAVARRSLDRNLADAGFVSARRILEAVRVTSAFRAITTSRTPLGHIATMLGYRSQRTLDIKLMLLLGTTGSKLRGNPLSCAEAASRLSVQLTSRELHNPKNGRPSTMHPDSDVTRGLKLVGNDKSNNRPLRRSASRNT